MRIKRIDHLVLTVSSIEQTVLFYQALGMERKTYGAERTALCFGDQKINLHQAGLEFEPKARNVAIGSADLCFIVDQAIDRAIEHLRKQGIEIIEGPVARTGARGSMSSVYCRDPDGNLIEIASYSDD